MQLRGGVRVRLRGVGRALERADVQRVVLLADHGDRRHDHAGQRPRFGWAPRAPAGLSRRRLHAQPASESALSRFSRCNCNDSHAIRLTQAVCSAQLDSAGFLEREASGWEAATWAPNERENAVSRLSAHKDEPEARGARGAEADADVQQAAQEVVEAVEEGAARDRGRGRGAGRRAGAGCGRGGPGGRRRRGRAAR